MNIQPINLTNSFRLNKSTSKAKHQNPISQFQNNSIGLSTNKIDNDKLSLAFLGLNEINSATKANNIPDKRIQATIDEANELAQALSQEVPEIYTKSQKILEEVTNLYREIQNGDYNGTAKLTDDVLEEFDEDGNLTRKSVFQDGVIDTIEEYHGKTKNIIHCYKGELNAYTKNQEDFADGSYKQEAHFFICNGHPGWCFKDIEHYSDDSFKRGVYALVSGDKPKIYYKNGYQTKDHSFKEDIRLQFTPDSDSPKFYSEGYSYFSKDGNQEYDLELQFIDGEWQDIKEESV